MSHLRCLILLLCFAVIVGPPTASAQSTDAKWYEVELIVFARNAGDRGQTEEWPQEPFTPDWSDATPIIARPTADIGETGATGVSQARTISIVPTSEYQLTGAKRQLDRTANRLQPLLHLAWRQPTTSRDTAEWLYLQAPFTNPASASTMGTAGGMTPRLEGAVKVSLSRYLHIDLDLLLREVAPQNETTTEYYNTLDYSPYVQYRMQTHRRMRSKELHYIDHPLMGVLVQVTPYEPPEPEPIAAPPTAEHSTQPNNATSASAPDTDQPASTQPVNPAE